MTHVLGVDLGGTAVSAAVAGDDGRAEMVALGDRSIMVPAVVHRRDGESVVTGEIAARRAGTDPSHAAWGVRRRLGDPAPVLLGEQTLPATDLLAAILRDVLGRVAAVRGEPPRRVVLTHPAGWGPFRRGLFEDVAVAAGIEDAAMMTDPQAAGGQHRAVHGLDDGAALAVFDLGGSSFEATVLARHDDALDLVGSPVDIERLGGVDFDEAVIALVDEASGGLLADLDPDDEASAAALARLRRDCLAAKETLSSEDDVDVPVLLPGRHAEVTVSRKAFEDRIRPTVTRSVEALARAVDAAPVRPEAVLLVGGSARVPLVGRAVAERLGIRVIVDEHPEHVVALGAARAASQLPSSAPSVITQAAGRKKATAVPEGSQAARSGSDGGGSKSAAGLTEVVPTQGPGRPRPVVDGRVPPTPDETAATTVTRVGPTDDAQTTKVRTPTPGSPADESQTTKVRVTPGTEPRPPAASPPTRTPPGSTPTPPRQGQPRPGVPSGTFPAVGRPGGPVPGAPGAGAPGGPAGRRPGPPGGPGGPWPGGPGGAPPPGRPMTGPFPGPPGPGPAAPATGAQPETASGRTRTVVIVVVGVLVLIAVAAVVLLVIGVL